jgi:hypothetical protein
LLITVAMIMQKDIDREGTRIKGTRNKLKTQKPKNKIQSTSC